MVTTCHQSVLHLPHKSSQWQFARSDRACRRCARTLASWTWTPPGRLPALLPLAVGRKGNQLDDAHPSHGHLNGFVDGRLVTFADVRALGANCCWVTSRPAGTQYGDGAADWIIWRWSWGPSHASARHSPRAPCFINTSFDGPSLDLRPSFEEQPGAFPVSSVRDPGLRMFRSCGWLPVGFSASGGVLHATAWVPDRRRTGELSREPDSRNPSQVWA